MTPYSHLDRVLTNDEWTALRQWLKDNPESRSHLGDQRPDGKHFLGYSKGYKGGERWGTEQTVLDTRRRMRENYAAKKGSDPAFLKTLLERRKARRDASDEVRQRENEYKRAWKLAHPEEESAYRGKRRLHRAGRQNAIHPDLDEGVIKTLYLTAIELTHATGIEHHVDHIIPVTYGGWHHQDNLQVLPHSVNSSKGNNPFWEHNDYLSWRDVPPSLWPPGLATAYSHLLAVPRITPLD